MQVFPQNASRNPALWSLVGTAFLAILVNRPPKPEFEPASPERVERERRFSELRPIAEQRRERIEHELRELGPHAWAGVYECRKGACRVSYDESIVIAPHGGFVWERFEAGSWGTTELGYGEVISASDSRIRIRFDLDPRVGEESHPSYRSSRFSEELITVEWGESRFLVPSTRAVELCSVYNSGLSLTQDFSTRLDDGRYLESDRPSGVPNVPAEYSRYLLSAAVTARVTAVGAVEVEWTSVRDERRCSSFEGTALIDAGRAEGLLPGMILYPSERPTPCTVTRVFEHASKVQFEFDEWLAEYQSSESLRTQVLPAMGCVLRTRFAR